MTSARCGLFLLQQQRTAQSAVSQCEDVSRALDAHTDHTNRALSFNYTNQAKKIKLRNRRGQKCRNFFTIKRDWLWSFPLMLFSLSKKLHEWFCIGPEAREVVPLPPPRRIVHVALPQPGHRNMGDVSWAVCIKSVSKSNEFITERDIKPRRTAADSLNHKTAYRHRTNLYWNSTSITGSDQECLLPLIRCYPCCISPFKTLH